MTAYVEIMRLSSVRMYCG